MTELAVILPAYNRVELLTVVLRRLLRNASELRLKVYLIDDGSCPPLSEQLPEEILSKVVLFPQENQGLVFAKYNGLLQVQDANYILFLDSDDFFDERKLSAQVKLLNETGADVCYTDMAKVRYSEQDKSISAPYDITVCDQTSDPVELYLHVQPAPHSPMFSRDYLLNALRSPLIPIHPIFNPIGEVWFYYNLLLSPAKIVKLDEPWTWTSVHDNERITNHWERLGVASLALMKAFMNKTSCNITATAARKRVSKAALEAYRKLPRSFDPLFEKELLTIWRQSKHSCPVTGGKFFQFVSSFIGTLTAAKLFKLWQRPAYHSLSTVDKEELESLMRTYKNFITEIK